MKNKLKIIICCCFYMWKAFFLFAGPFGGADIVFDPTSWLELIEQVYQSYDLVVKNVTMIEQNYEQMRFYLDRAKTFNFQEIEWDGDLDFRNEIFSATNQMDKYLDNVRGVRDNFKKKNIRVGTNAYSLEDLIGLGDENKSIEDYVHDLYNNVESNFEKAANAFEEGLSEEEAAFLWSRYGLKPSNYYMINSVKKVAQKSLTDALAMADEEIVANKDETFYKTVSEVMGMIDTEESMTEPELQQVGILMQQQTAYAIKDLEHTLGQAVSFQAWNYSLEKQEEEQKRLSEEKDLIEAMKKQLPYGF